MSANMSGNVTGNRTAAASLASCLAGALCLVFAAGTAVAYDGTKCEAPGNCWEPKPGYPEKVEGSKYDPRHDPTELAKQALSIKAMEERNAKRVAHFKKTGKWEYDVKKIPE